jgi:hypothetical protein
MGSLEFSKLLVEKADVAVAPGIGFGEHGDDYVRIALVENEQRIRQAARNIRKFFDNADQTLHNVVPRSARARQAHWFHALWGCEKTKSTRERMRSPVEPRKHLLTCRTTSARS